jgi:hypothetical protein
MLEELEKSGEPFSEPVKVVSFELPSEVPRRTYTFVSALFPELNRTY